jgi:hypothetical protein
MSDQDFFIELNLWRLANGVPDEVFVTVDHQVIPTSAKRIPIRLQTFKRKPQYLDFTSPMFLHRIERIIRTAELCVTFEEIYPPLDQQLLHRGDQAHVSEFLAEVVLD